MSRKAKVRTKSILSKIFCSLIYIVLFMPIAVVVVNSFNATTSKPYLTWKGFTFDWYVKLFENQSLLTSFGNTMIIALVTTVLSTIIGTLGAIGMYKYKFKGKGINISLPSLRIDAFALDVISIDDVIISYFVNGNTMTYPLQVMASIKSGVAPDVNALSALILAGTIIFVVLTQGNLFKKKKQ